MSTAFDIHTAYRSDAGRVREDNQDSCIELRNRAGGDLLVVADGMGGANGGAIASRTLIDCLREHFEGAPAWSGELLRTGIAEANERIYRAACETPELRGMGTTAVAALLGADGHAWVAHVGDCRAYLRRSGKLHRLTEDHSVVAELVRHGRIAESAASEHPQRNEILRSVGVRPKLKVDLAEIDFRHGDWLLLCSDGLCGVIDDDEIGRALSGHRPVDVVPRLIEGANAAGGPDNVTVMVSAIRGGPGRAASIIRRIAAVVAVIGLGVGGWFAWHAAPNPRALLGAPPPLDANVSSDAESSP